MKVIKLVSYCYVIIYFMLAFLVSESFRYHYVTLIHCV